MLKVLKLNDYSDIKLPHWPQVLFGSNKVPTSHQHQHVFGPEHALKLAQSPGSRLYVLYNTLEPSAANSS